MFKAERAIAAKDALAYHDWRRTDVSHEEQRSELEQLRAFLHDALVFLASRGPAPIETLVQATRDAIAQYRAGGGE